MLRSRSVLFKTQGKLFTFKIQLNGLPRTAFDTNETIDAIGRANGCDRPAMPVMLIFVYKPAALKNAYAAVIAAFFNYPRRHRIAPK